MPNKQNTNSNLQGLTRLITDATIGITNLVEAMHKRVVHPPFLPSTPIQELITNISGITYKSIRWSTKFIGSNAEKALGQLPSVLGEIETSSEKEAVNSALNGVVGDYLEENNNPLQINMQFRQQATTISLDSEGIAAAYPTINGKILLMVHGLCMNDIQWTRKEHNHGTALAKELDKTPVFLHYNTGRHISNNGQNFNELLEKLISNWPVQVEELIIVAHSMGGLVTRSALHLGQQQQNKWTTLLQKIVFLGTPHHGAPLERAGNYLDVILEAVPYAKPFARLGKIRSAGITDLRYGNLVDEDWNTADRFEMRADARQIIPLPEQVACFSVAATIGKATDSVSSRLLGDNLVGVKSAMGQHENSAYCLNFKAENTWIVYESNHWDLLSDLKVYGRVKGWLA